MSRRSWQDVCRNPLEGHNFKPIPVVEYRPKTQFAHVKVLNKRCTVCGYLKAICISANGRRKSFYKPSTLPKGWRYEETDVVPSMLDYAAWLEEDLRAASTKQRRRLSSVA